jgi:hypothetical protein
MRPRSIRSLIGAAVLLSLSVPATAGTVSLAWDPASGAAGYRVYYGSSSGSYTQSVDVGSATSATVSGLGDCQSWYLAVKAYNNAGESPGFSNEITGWPAPRVDSTSPSSRKQGDQFTLDINGANFRSGATVQADNPNVFLGSPSIQCNQISVATTIEPTAAGVRAAEVGPLTVSVDNPDTTFDDGVGVFDVLVNPARFDISADPGPSQGRLDGRDTILLSTLFGSQEGDAVYDPDADYDGDGWIDGQDLAYLAGNLGKCWNGSEWTVSACPAGLQ